jgi:glycosyltransferase EpsD
MPPKILFTASIPYHFKAFHLPYLKWFQEQGYETHVACNGFEELPYVNKMWQVDFVRTPFSFGHFNALIQLNEIILKEDFNLINCHTPMASVLTRLASFNARKVGVKLIYTAHGFHFFKGSAIINWLIYYPVEVFLSKYTDAIVCINTEDFDRIKKIGSTKCDYFLIPGIGVEGSRFFNISKVKKNEIREEKGFIGDDFILVYSAEFISRKNHLFIIDSVIKNKNKFNGIKILFAGKGKLQEALQKKVLRNKVQEIIQFIGFRNDIHEIYQLSDIGISSSKQEGLPVNIIESMMCGLPVIASFGRGHNELVENHSTGILFESGDHTQFVESIFKIKNDKTIYTKFSKNALVNSERFEIRNSFKSMIKIYNKYLQKV